MKLLVLLLLPLAAWAQDLRVLSGGAAKSVVYIDPKIGTSGKRVAEVPGRLGVSQEIEKKARLGQGGYIVERPGELPRARERLAQAGYTAPE